MWFRLKISLFWAFFVKSASQEGFLSPMPCHKTKKQWIKCGAQKMSNENKEIPQNYDAKIAKLLGEMVDLTVVSEKGHGKTVMVENLAQKIIENPANRLIVFESFPKWSLEFPAKFLEIPKSWVVETDKTINLENTWIRHDTAYTVLHGDIISQFLKENHNCTFLLNNDDLEPIAFFVYSVIYKFYRLRYDMLRKGYPITEKVYFVLEEAQNSLSSQVLSSKLFRRYRKLFSEMRNMGLYAILITQRLQDINTYFRCRTSLALGKISLDDYDLKIKKMLAPIGINSKVLDMAKGTFYFTAINDTIAFPMFQPTKPTEFKPQLAEKPKTLMERFKRWWNGENYKQPTKEEIREAEEIEKEAKESEIEDSQLDLYMTNPEAGNEVFPEEIED
jgi:hypothetical protein